MGEAGGRSGKGGRRKAMEEKENNEEGGGGPGGEDKERGRLGKEDVMRGRR